MIDNMHGFDENMNKKSVAETITNENGTAIKFSDGTMICRHTISKEEFMIASDLNAAAQGINIYRSNNPKWNFPVSFIDENIQVQANVNNSTIGTRLTFVRLANISRALIEIQLLGLESFTETGDAYKNLKEVYITATGCWK